MYPSRPKRLPAFAYQGNYRYSLCFCTDGRRDVFISDDVVAFVLAQISRAAVETSFALIAYCFMPDHVHLLVAGETEASDCKRLIALAKQYSAFYYSKRFGRRLWQRYVFERVLRESEETTVVTRYILENPIRAGLG